MLRNKAERLKRVLDITGALVGIVLTCPVLVVAGLLILIEDGGPLLFRQTRIGKNGRPFCILKIRTMKVGAEKQLDQVLPLNILKGPAYKIPNDPRITRVGRFLRRWSLDEMPQFFNVLHGEMSLVGPRPEQPWVVDKYSDEQRRRLAVKPGLTGLMQINGRGLLEDDERFRLDMAYVENCSVLNDLGILFKTIPVILSGKGAF
jgi:lipopolysaccharide/colanic/teichoic acid biosynthesis glycosyltransferase